MKKILAILCAIALVCSLAMVVYAEETVIASDLEHASGWVQTDVYTTLWGGTLDPSIFVEGGRLEIHLTTTMADLWQVRVCLNAPWTELDWHVDPTTVANGVGTLVDNGDGTAVVTFTYEDMVRLYGMELAGNLGCITIVTNGASPATVNKVVYVVDSVEEEIPETTETPAPTVQPDATNPKDGDAISAVVALLAVSACGIAVLSKKKEF